jgi:hypothetical protein
MLLSAAPAPALPGVPQVPEVFHPPFAPGVLATKGDNDGRKGDHHGLFDCLGPVVPPPPCHPNSDAVQDILTVKHRGDIRHLPRPLRQRLIALAARPHSILPVQARAEADMANQLFQYYLLDTRGFEPNVLTAIFPGINDQVMLAATGADCGLPTIGAVRLVLEPKPGLPTDPTDPRADGHAQFGKLLQADAELLKNMGSGHNLPEQFFTTDGKAVRLPSESDHFPDVQTNVVPIQLSMGAYNALQQSDVHSYWEFNYQTNCIHPLYELPFTGGIPKTFEDGKIGAL